MLIALVAVAPRPAHSLDLTWLPADPDGPLPLSQSYRDSLERLCVLVEGPSPLPPDIVAKRELIEKLCVKLRRGQRQVSKGNGRFGDVLRTLRKTVRTAAVVGLGGSAVSWAIADYSEGGVVQRTLRPWVRKIQRALR